MTDIVNACILYLLCGFATWLWEEKSGSVNDFIEATRPTSRQLTSAIVGMVVFWPAIVVINVAELAERIYRGRS